MNFESDVSTSVGTRSAWVAFGEQASVTGVISGTELAHGSTEPAETGGLAAIALVALLLLWVFAF